MKSVNRLLALDRDDMSDLERELFLKDLKRVTDEYFESDGEATLEVTRADEGFIVCVLMTARTLSSILLCFSTVSPHLQAYVCILPSTLVV